MSSTSPSSLHYFKRFNNKDLSSGTGFTCSILKNGLIRFTSKVVRYWLSITGVDEDGNIQAVDVFVGMDSSRNLVISLEPLMDANIKKVKSEAARLRFGRQVIRRNGRESS